MKVEISKTELVNHVNRQLGNFFGPNCDISGYIDESLFRVEKCFTKSMNKYYRDTSTNEICFSPYNTSQYTVFLYFLSNTIGRTQNELAVKVYYLNKIMHSVDLYFAIELPEYWGVEHPLGSVMGRAKYKSGLFFYQGCTIGGNKGAYPVLGNNTILYSNVTILGNTKIGDNVIFSSGTTVKDEIIPENCLVFGQSPNLIIKKKDQTYMQEKISKFWNDSFIRNEGQIE